MDKNRIPAIKVKRAYCSSCFKKSKKLTFFKGMYLCRACLTADTYIPELQDNPAINYDKDYSIHE